MRQGKKVTFGNGELTLHPLNLAQLQELQDDIAQMRGINKDTALSIESNARLARILATAASRAHPDIKPEAVMAMIDLQDVSDGTVGEAMKLLMGASGLAPVPEGANGARPPSPQIGGDSTLDSAPP